MIRPLRVVSLLPSATETLCLIGGRNLLVGRSHECDYPPDVKHLPILTWQKTNFTTSADVDRQVRESLSSGKSLYGLYDEMLEELKPDVILTQNLCDVCSVDLAAVQRTALRLSSKPLVVSLDPYSLRDVLDDIVRVGAAVGLEDAAKAHRAALQERVDRVVAMPRLGINVGVLEWVDPLFIGGHWTPELIEMAGGKHPLGAAGKKSVTVSAEDFVRSDPDKIMIAPCGLELSKSVEEIRKCLETQSWWGDLRAVKSGIDCAVVDGNLMFNRPGPRLVDALEWLSEWLRFEAGKPAPSSQTLSVFPWRAYRHVLSVASTPSAPAPAPLPQTEEIRRHEEACQSQRNTYVDPSSGFQVMTEFYLTQRGWCCGNGCRHCPYGHWNVQRANGRKNGPTKTILLSLVKERQKILNRIETAPRDAVQAVFWDGGATSLLAFDWAVTHGLGLANTILLIPLETDTEHYSQLLDQARSLPCDALVVPLPSKCGAVDYESRVAAAIAEHPALCKRDRIDLIFSDLHIAEVRSWRESSGFARADRVRTRFPLFDAEIQLLQRDLFGRICDRYSCEFVVSSLRGDKTAELRDIIGKRFDESLTKTLVDRAVDPFGEFGEFKVLMVPRKEKKSLDW